jgi:GNAT superfamily N-acetyltransferase
MPLMSALRPTTGAHLEPARLGDLRRLLGELEPDDLGALDPGLGDWLRRPFGREALASVVLPASGSVFLSLMNIEPAGLIVLERGEIAARVRVLAVARDMRRRGLARTMLLQSADIARDRGIDWLWMSIAAGNAGATRCALTNGFRRFLPQYLRRERSGALTMMNIDIRIEALNDDAGLEAATRWIAYESNIGDDWCAPLAQADLLKWSAPHGGRYYMCIHGDRDIGLAHIASESAGHARIRLWLEESVWGGPLERAALKGVVDMMRATPARIDLELGSSSHLRAAVELYRALGFKPCLHDRVTFVKRVNAVDDAGAESDESP